jgi:putative N6-adenine-specific DNA methylase
LHIDKNKARISLDTSGGSLHKRGYRIQSVPAPMQETLAATILRISGWQGNELLLDPMCGSGTILSEALLSFCRIPPAFKHEKFGFEYLPDFDESGWQKIRQKADNLRIPLKENLISGCDIDQFAVNSARTNLNTLPNSRLVRIQKRDFRNHPGLKNGLIITNPPYGIRLGNEKELEILYKDFGDFLKQKCTGSTAWIYCGNRNLIKFLGLKPSQKIPLVNGNLDGRLVKVEIY